MSSLGWNGRSMAPEAQPGVCGVCGVCAVCAAFTGCGWALDGEVDASDVLDGIRVMGLDRG